MSRTMKAAVVREFKQPLVIEEVPVPTPGAGQVLVKIEASGVCHTDLHAAEGDWPVKPKPPFIPGHEGVGHVAAVGKGVVARQGRRPRRGPVASLGVRPLHALHRRLGDVVREASRTPATR